MWAAVNRGPRLSVRVSERGILGEPGQQSHHLSVRRTLLGLPRLEMGRGRSKLILIASCSDCSECSPPYSIHRCSIPVAVQSSWPWMLAQSLYLVSEGRREEVVMTSRVGSKKWSFQPPVQQPGSHWTPFLPRTSSYITVFCKRYWVS